MKKLIHLVLWAALLAAIAWLLRDRLVPAPETAADERPRYRVPPAPEPPPAADDLRAVKGIGPAYAARLADAGVTTFAQLAAADAEDLAARTGLGAGQIADWIDQASTLAG